MDLYTINYVREESSWYKYLNRDSSYLKVIEEEMQKKYKLTTQDRIAKISQGISLVSNILDVLK